LLVSLADLFPDLAGLLLMCQDDYFAMFMRDATGIFLIGDPFTELQN